MFHKLRLQLTLINLAIITLLFLILTVGTYFLFQDNMKKHSNFMNHQLARDIESGKFRELPKPKNDMPRGFFVKTSSTGEVIFQSAYQPLKPKDLAILLQGTLKARENQGNIVLNKTEYSYLKKPLLDKLGWLVIFHNLEPEKRLLPILLNFISVW